MKVGNPRREWLQFLLCASLYFGIPEARGQSAPEPQRELIVVNVGLNAQKKGDLFVLRVADGDFLMREEDLRSIGLSAEALPQAQVIDGTKYVSLRSIRGVQFSFEPSQLALEITADPQILPGTSISAAARRLEVVRLRQNSAFVNYAYSRGGGDHGVSTNIASEAGLRVGDFMLLSNANSRMAASSTQTVRLMTSAVRDNAISLQRLTIGDFFTTPGEVGSTVNMGGLRFAKQYGLDPTIRSYPLGLVQGQVSLPSEIDVIVNGQRIRTDHLQPGAFEVRDLTSYAGAQSVELVVRDAFGRSQQLNYTLYFAEEPLRQGLHDYQYAVGALRRDYGLASNKYGEAAFSAYHKYGLTNGLTLGWRGEGRAGLLNTGPVGTVVLGRAGVLNFTLAQSAAGGSSGHAALLRYSYNAANVALGATARRDSAAYVALRDSKIIENRKWEGTAFASRYIPGVGLFSVSHSLLTVRAPTAAPPAPGFTAAAFGPRRVTTLAYHTALPWAQSTLSVNVSRIRDERGPRSEINFGVRIALDPRRSITAATRLSHDQPYEAVSVTQTAPVGLGWGYDLVADRQRDAIGTTSQVRARTQVNTSMATLRADYTHSDSVARSNDYSVSVAGGVAWVGGGAYLGRPVDDSFGVAKVGELPGIPVTVNGLPAGVTNEKGLLFLPSLTSFYENQVSIDARAVPIEYTVGHITRRVTFPMRSGAIIDFDARRVQAVTGTLVKRDVGGALPIELTELVIDGPSGKIESATGAKGEIYIENLQPGRYAGQASATEAKCTFEFAVPATTDLFVELGELACK